MVAIPGLEVLCKSGGQGDVGEIEVRAEISRAALIALKLRGMSLAKRFDITESVATAQ